MATHSSILAWRIPWTAEPGGYSPQGHKELDTTEHVRARTHTHTLEYLLRARNLHSELLPLTPDLLQQTMMQKSARMFGGKAVEPERTLQRKRKRTGGPGGREPAEEFFRGLPPPMFPLQEQSLSHSPGSSGVNRKA